MTIAPCNCGVDSSGTPRGPGTELLKAKVLVGGPCKSRKTILANFLTEASDITEYNQTQGEDPGIREPTCYQQTTKAWGVNLSSGIVAVIRVTSLTGQTDEGL